MSPFEYVIVLISIILGLGITTILTGVANWIRQGSSGTKIYFPYVIWIGLVFILHFHEWWTSYSFMNMKEWNLFLFLFMILYPIVLYLLANLLFPQKQFSDFNSKSLLSGELEETIFSGTGVDFTEFCTKRIHIWFFPSESDCTCDPIPDDWEFGDQRTGA